VFVRTENIQVDDNYVLSVYVRAPKTRPSMMKTPSSTLSKSSMGMSYGSLKEAEVLESSTLKKFSVLVVDNSISTLKSIEKQISDTGHFVDTEQGQDEALENLKRKTYDVALIEIGRLGGGEISGLEVAHEWRIFERLYQQTSSPLIIIAMSSEYDDSMFLEAMNAGFDGFIVKPFATSDLLSIILMIDEERNDRK
jgi:CheY-like chemotaxis protein